ncbi:MAG: FlgD immunoglobulin-like domain containing protein, partial [bacterium]
QLARDGMVTLSIYNLLGQAVRTLVNKNQTAGSYSIVWDGNNNAGELAISGVYFYKLKVGESFLVTRKMVLLR